MTAPRPLAAIALLIGAADLAVAAAQGVPAAALAGSAPVEQAAHGTRPPLPLLEAFDGLGADLHAGEAPPRNPSDNSLAVGPDHIVQTVNSQVAVFTKKGTKFEATGRLLYGPTPTHTFFAGYGEICGGRPNGDAVVRYDQLARRWLVVMPIFRRAVPAPEPGAREARVADRATRPEPGRHPIRARRHGRPRLLRRHLQLLPARRPPPPARTPCATRQRL